MSLATAKPEDPKLKYAAIASALDVAIGAFSVYVAEPETVGQTALVGVGIPLLIDAFFAGMALGITKKTSTAR